MISELRTAIATIGQGLAGFSGGFWYIEAPADCVYPYAVFSVISETNSRDSARVFEEIDFQINVYGLSGTNTELLKERVITAFDDSEGSFSLASYHFERIERTLVRPQKLGKVFMITIQYKINLTRR